MRFLASLTVLFTVTTASLCSAQPFEIMYSIPSYGTGDFTETLSFHFDDDCLEDLAYIQGGEVFVVLAPGLYGITVQIPTSGAVNAILRLPRQGNEPDELVVADNDGLAAWEWDPTATSTNFIASRPIGSAAWSNARALTLGSDESTLYGLNVTGTQFLVHDGGIDSISAMPSIGLDLVEIEWDQSNAIDEVAISVSSGDEHGIMIVEVSGTGLDYLWLPNAPEDIGVVVENGKEFIAAVGKGINGVTDQLVVYGAAGLNSLITFGNIDTVGMAAQDLNEDGDTDLVISRDATDEAVIVWGPSSTTSPTYLTTAGTTPPAGQTQVPTIIDADQDGDLDIVQWFHSVPTAGAGAMLVHLQELLPDPNNDFGESNPDQPYFTEVAYFEHRSTTNQDQGILCFELNPPPSGYPASSTHIEIGFWTTTYTSGNGGGTWSTPAAAGRRFAALPASGLGKVLLAREFDLPDFNETRKNLVILYAARYVTSSNIQAQTYDRVFSPLIHAFAAIPDPSLTTYASIEQLEDLASASNAGQLFSIQDPANESPAAFATAAGITLGTVHAPWEDLQFLGADPSNTGTGTPVRPLPEPSEFPMPRFGENGT